MAKVKTKSAWCPSLFERRVAEVARRAAEREAACIPWRRLQEAREKYLDWEAFALWVRAVEEAEGRVPLWLTKAINERYRGFLKFVAEENLDHSDGPSFFWRHLERWVNE